MSHLKTTSILLSFLLISSVSFALSDIPGHKNQAAIQYLYDNEVINGYEDGTFQPEKVLNRAELIKILVGGVGVQPNETEYKNCFPDVQEEWFAPYVCYGKEQGWVEGYEDNTFKPAKEVNRVEAIKMLVNSQGYETPELVEEKLFDDADSTQWYAPYLKAAKEKGLLEEESGNFDIGGFMTRAAISENIYRAMILPSPEVTNEEKDETLESETVNDLYEVVEVIDGDTISVQDGENTKMTVRVIGIDTPETVHPSKPVECYGPEASERATELLLGKMVTLEVDESQGDTDKYDRLLRHIVFENGDLYGELMIADGYAQEYTYNEEYNYQEYFIKAEEAAKAGNLGLWNDSACEEEQAEDETVEQEEYVAAQCKNNTFNCSDFNSYSEAQKLFNFCMNEVGTDIHKLDADNNGMACEGLR